jgi:hypothetical protein
MDSNHDKVIQSLFAYDAFAIGTMFVAGTGGQMFQNLGACLCDRARVVQVLRRKSGAPSYLLGKKTTLGK